ncbi:hybrid sensor histidine kinase/response regulator [Yeosuana marina]|uniref:hybrid sensor histidine kinase/response regulator n=1 Tax=Yeosuana marina TaxID=1565536 RepID=UPI0030C8319C
MTEFQRKLRILDFIPNNFTKKELFKILNNIDISLAIVDENQNILFANQQLLNLGGFSNLKGEKCKNSFCSNISCPCLAMSDENSSKTTKTRFIKKDGTFAIVNVIAHKLDFNNKECTLIFVIDITEEEELKKHQDLIIKEKSIAEEKALKEAEKFEFLFENMGDVQYLLNIKGDFIKVNKKTLTHLGYSKEELLSMSVFDINQSQTIFNFNYLIENIKNGKNLLFETNHVTKKGEIKTVEIVSSYINLDDEDYVFNSVRDITLRKNLEHDLLISKEKAQESERLKSAFLNNISHQIRTPLNGILGFADILENNFTDLTLEKRKEYFNIIRNSGNKLLQTVEDILEVSKLNCGLPKLKSDSFALKINLERLIDEMKETYLNNNNTFCFEIDPDLETMMIKTDNNMLMRVLKSLVDNAFKFNTNNIIKLIVQNKNEHLLFSVQDNGEGIPEKYIDSIFDPFTQTEHTLKQAINGTGLGLTIAKNLVNCLGGELKVENLPEKGSRFYFAIPFKVKNPLEKTGNLDAYKKPLMCKTILIAEDDLLTYMLLETKLKQEGCNLVHALNGKEAIEYFKSNKRIDLIIMDINMPIMDGLEAAQVIRKINDKIPILAHSAFVHNEYKDNYYKYGFSDFLNKPTDTRRLIETIITCFKN